MALQPNSELGVYQIRESIGIGGMGEVYRARDSKLDRHVAIKVLPEAFWQDAQRLARFEQEARVLAALNHPNIATLYALEESKGIHFLVMELVPGVTLAERIASASLSPTEALSVFHQIADALEAAHEQGVIHRDLKPGNVKVTPDGIVKVLDFGLAKQVGSEGAPADSSQAATKTKERQPFQNFSPLASPTLPPDVTAAGVIVGTAPYMSPEQVRGRAVDRRADIWAFGCCLYEALAGKPAFPGREVIDIFAAILKSDPDWEDLPTSTPPRVRELTRRCLRKDPRRRMRDMGDVRITLKEAVSGEADPNVPPSPQRSLPWAIAALAVIFAVAVGVASRSGVGGLFSSEPVRFLIPFPPGTSLPTSVGRSELAISPDGSLVAYVAEGRSAGETRIYLRELNAFETLSLEGSEGAHEPFFSPDGQWIGFFGDGKLKKASVDGGPAVNICDSARSYGATWNDEGVVIFGQQSAEGGLWRVPSSGGNPEPVTQVDFEAGEVSHRTPYALPGKTAVLFTVIDRSLEPSIELLDLKTGGRQKLIERGSAPSYAATGHILYMESGALTAVAFDSTRLRLDGPPAPVLEGVRERSLGRTFHVSDNGTLVYLPRMRGAQERTLVWAGRDGSLESITNATRAFADPSVSPSGRRLAVAVGRDEDQDLWTYDIVRDAFSRLTYQGYAMAPVWTPDGKRLTFVLDGEILSIPADGTPTTERLYSSDSAAVMLPTSWSPDGKTLAFMELRPGSGFDIALLSTEEEGGVRPFLRTRFDEQQPMFSPSGNWIAYTSDESGRDEVYVQAYPGPGQKVKISANGGNQPRWSLDGKELYYLNKGQMMVVVVDQSVRGADLAAGKARLLFEGLWYSGSAVANYDVTPEGSRFLMMQATEADIPTEINVILNWFDELSEKVGPS